ncbi:MAG: protein kinase [Candidatus Enterosoma sp.]|nr:protein kinase [Bacilli bacterium]MDY3907521.1 protein kinase [Candidatus Enterosoma sp.]MDY5649708.1 protein kinase [Candidatus Enterosoma sp.]
MADILEINDIVDDRYKIVSLLGEGGMALVYKANDLITSKDVALKIMRPETAIDKTNLSRFEREARAAASLNHQNIVRVNNLGTYKGYPYMVNELITGQTLRQILDIRGKFSIIESLDIMEQLCRAISYAHQHGVIHRDIKPQNIFLASDGTIKLADFGIATFQNANHVTRSEIVIGSVHYMAPEISQGHPASERSDIYSMGITFFELITGKVPFDSQSAVTVALMHIKDKFPSIKKFNNKTPQCVEEIILKAVNKDPIDRYNSAEEMRSAINNILSNRELLTKKKTFFSKLFKRKDSSKKI